MEEQELPSTQGLVLDSPLWDFALDIWRDQGIREYCLNLQKNGWSVTRILCACWLATLGQRFEQEPDGSARWRSGMTGPLRTLRQALPKSSAEVASLRSRLAQAELEAEQVELALAFEGLAAQSKALADHNTLSRLLAQNLRNAAPGNPDMTPHTEHLILALSRRLELHRKSMEGELL